MLRVLTYNIHKGLSWRGRSCVTSGMREALHAVGADLVFLQEVVGKNDLLKLKFDEWPVLPQHEFFLSQKLMHVSYGKNAEYKAGHHGNAILSRNPFGYEANLDASLFKFSRRGFLYARLHPEGRAYPLHAFCVHLGLLNWERQRQTDYICRFIEERVPREEPVILAGDFNDWRERLSETLYDRCCLKEAFKEHYGFHQRTFPSHRPLLRLDRIYFRHLNLLGCTHESGEPWTALSDHLPLIADFAYL